MQGEGGFYAAPADFVRGLRKICDEHLAGRYSIEVVDLIENPALGRGDQARYLAQVGLHPRLHRLRYSVQHVGGLVHPAALVAGAGPDLVQRLPEAERTIADGYGAFVTYQLQGGDQTELVSAFTEPLYGSPAQLR